MPESEERKRPEPWDVMRRLVDSLLTILDQEIHVYVKVLTLAQKEKESVIRSDLVGLRAAIDERSCLVRKIEGLEQNRQEVVEDLSRALGRPARELSLREISRWAEEPFKTRLEEMRSHLLDLGRSISDTSTHNKAFIDHRLRLIRGCLCFLGKSSSATTVYRQTGKMVITSDRSGRVLSGEY